jgi:hypothetical protein
MSIPLKTKNTITRPANATQYAVGDLVASAVAGDDTGLAMAFASGPYIVRRARLFKSSGDTTSAVFRLHLFRQNPYASPTSDDTGDNGALSLSASDTGYMGSMDFDMTTSPDIYDTGNVAIGVPLVGNEILVDNIPISGPYGLLEARATYTPASAERFTIILEYMPS